MKRRVVVTGLGIVSPLGLGVDENEAAVFEGRSGVDYIETFSPEENFPVKIAGEVGLDPNSAKKILDNRDFKTNVDEDWALSHKMAITGVPTFYSNELTLVGCQPYEILEKFVNHLIELKYKN